MKPRSRSTRQLVRFIRQLCHLHTTPPRKLTSLPDPSRPSLCRSCLLLHKTSYSTATAPTTSSVPSSPPPGTITPFSAPVSSPSSASQNYLLSASVLLLRSPLITRTPTPFESSYYLYQRRLNERLSLPFTHKFYFSPDTPALTHWQTRTAQRSGVAARDTGGYSASGPEAWNDELLIPKDGEGDVASLTHQREAILKDADMPRVSGGGVVVEEAGGPRIERPAERVTDADKAGDRRSLNRALERTLILVVKVPIPSQKEGVEGKARWIMPAARIETRESLTEAAERVVESTAGVNLQTWLIGHNPVGYVSHRFAKKPEDGAKEIGEKTFFLKARALAGQVNLEGNRLGFADYAWLTKEEVKEAVSKEYWAGVRHMLPEL